MSFILAKKIEMSQVFKKDGTVVPVTLLEAGPCFVTQVKNKEKDGTDGVQIGFIKKKDNKIKKTEKGKGYKYLREFKTKNTVSDTELLRKGDEINVSVFKVGDIVKVSSVSKGKGFQGAVKKWGFHGRPATHGVKHEERTLGSVGATGPGKVFKGKKMPGRMGGERITVKNLEIIKIDEKNHLIAIKGAIPGRRGILVEIKS